MARGGGGWSADGRRLWLLRETEAGAVALEVWNFDTETWPEIACDVAGRNMTEVEWEQYGPRTIERRATCPEFPLETS